MWVKPLCVPPTIFTRNAGAGKAAKSGAGFRSKSTVMSAVPPATSTARRGWSPWNACPSAFPATAASATTAVRSGSARLAGTTAAPPREWPTSPPRRPRGGIGERERGDPDGEGAVGRRIDAYTTRGQGERGEREQSHEPPHTPHHSLHRLRKPRL